MRKHSLHRPAYLFCLLSIFLFFGACAQEPPKSQSALQGKSHTEWLEQGEDWASFLGPRGNGHSAEKGLDPSLWKPHPPILWDIPLGISYGGPAVVGQKLYQFDRVLSKERLTCYDVSNGKPLWHWDSDPVNYRDMFNYNNGPRCSPIIDGDLIFLYGVTGQLHCIDAQSHKSIWSVDTMKKYGVIPNFFGVASNPFVFGDKLLVMIGGSPQESQSLKTEELALVKPNNCAIVAFDKRTGKELYKTGNDLSSYTSMMVQEVAGKSTGLGFLRSGLIAFDPNDGKELFQYPWRADFLESVNAAVPVTDGQRVLVSESYQIGSTLLNATTSPWSIQWKDSGARNRLKFRAHWATPVLIDGYLYGCNGRNEDDSDFRCVRWEDGNVQWTHRSHERSSVIVVDGYLVVLGENGKLELIKPNPDKLDVVASSDLSQVASADGQPLLTYPCWAAPVVSHGLLYIRGNDRLICMQLIPKAK
jgi:outer membrane protein assembly factor BamB